MEQGFMFTTDRDISLPIANNQLTQPAPSSDNGMYLETARNQASSKGALRYFSAKLILLFWGLALDLLPDCSSK